MNRCVAFLRGMNLGGRRITNDELCGHFTELGFANVEAFLASGNVIFDAAESDAAVVAAQIEDGLREALSYEVPTFLRTADEVRAIARRQCFAEEEQKGGGKLQVAMFRSAPTTAARKAVLALATVRDHLALCGRELFWLPQGNMSQSELDLKAIEKALGPMTIRTKRTVERITAKYLS